MAGSCGGLMVKHPWPLLEINLSDFRWLATLNINTYLPNGPFSATFCQFLDKSPMFMENLPKNGPFFREFRPKTHQYEWYIPVPSINVLCNPPPSGSKGSNLLEKKAFLCHHHFLNVSFTYTYISIDIRGPPKGIWDPSLQGIFQWALVSQRQNCCAPGLHCKL